MQQFCIAHCLLCTGHILLCIAFTILCNLMCNMLCNMQIVPLCIILNNLHQHYYHTLHYQLLKIIGWKIYVSSLKHFSTSEVVLHTCGPSHIVAMYVPYRRSIKYFFSVERGKQNRLFFIEDYIIFGNIYYLISNSSS